MQEQKNKPTIFTLKDQLLLSMINKDKMNTEMKCDEESQEETNGKKCLMRVCCNLNERLRGYIEKVNIVEELWLRHESKQNELKYDIMLNENNCKKSLNYNPDVGDPIESKNTNILPYLQQANDNLFTYHNNCKRYPLDLTDFNKFLLNYKRRHGSRTRLIKELKRENMRLKAYSRDLYDRFKTVTGKSEFNYESFTTDSNFENLNRVRNNENEFIECSNSLASFSDEKTDSPNRLNKTNYNLETIYDQNQQVINKNKLKLGSTANIKMNILMLQSHLKALKSSEKDSGFQQSSSCQHQQCSDDSLTDNCEHLSTCVDNEVNVIVNKENNFDNMKIANHDKNINESSEILERKIKARENVNFDLLSEILSLKNQLTECEKCLKERNIRLYYLQNELAQKEETIHKLNSEIEAINATMKINFNKLKNSKQANFNETSSENEKSLRYMLNDFIHNHNFLQTELESKSRIIEEMNKEALQTKADNAMSVDILRNQLNEDSSSVFSKNQLEEEHLLLQKGHKALLLRYSESQKLCDEYKFKYANDLKIIRDFEAEINSLRVEISLSKEQHESNLNSLTKVSNLHKENYETTLETLTAIDLKNKTLSDSESKLKIDNENLKELVFKLNNDNSYLNTQLNKSNYNSISSHQDIDKLKTDFKLLVAENDELKKDKNHLREQIKKLESELVKYEEECFRVENKMDILKDENNQFFLKMDSMELELNKLLSENESLVNTNQKLTEEFSQIKKKMKISDKLSLENESLKSCNEKLNADLSLAGADLSLRDNELRKMCLQFESAKLQLLGVADELRDKNQKFDQLIIDSTTNLKNKEQEIELLKSEIKEFEVNLTQKNKSLADHDKIYSLLRNEIEVLKKNNQHSLNIINKSETEIKNKMTEFECMKCGLETRNHNLLAQINDSTRQCEKLQHEISKYKQKLSNLESNNQKLNIENSQLQSQNLSTENNLQFKKLKTDFENLKTENLQLKNESNDKKVDVSRLTDNFNTLWTKCDVMTAEFNRVNSQLLKLQTEHANCGALKKELSKLQTDHLYCKKVNDQLTELRVQHQKCSELNAEVCKLREENDSFVRFNGESSNVQCENLDILLARKKEYVDSKSKIEDVKQFSLNQYNNHHQHSVEFDMLVSELGELKKCYSEGISIYAQQNQILKGVVEQLELKNSDLQKKLKFGDIPTARAGRQKEKVLRRANSFNCGDAVNEHKSVNGNYKSVCFKPSIDQISLEELNKNESYTFTNDKINNFACASILRDDSKFNKLIDKKQNSKKHDCNFKKCNSDSKFKGRIGRKLPIVRPEDAFFKSHLEGNKKNLAYCSDYSSFD